MDAPRQIKAHRNQKGMMIVIVALLITFLCLVLGFALDLGHLQVVRGELQNAADAAALAGATALFPDPPDGAALALDWEGGELAARRFVSENKSDGEPLSGGTIDVGYWDMNSRSWVARAAAPSPPPPQLVQAVRVSVGRSGETGEVPTYFMKVAQPPIESMPVNSRPAVAARGYVGSVPPGDRDPTASPQLFPIAVPKCMTDLYFHSPDPSQQFEFRPTPAPYPGVAACYTGQWTSLFRDNGNNGDVKRYLVARQQVPAVSTRDSIWILSFTAVMDDLYLQVMNDFVGKDVLIPIVEGDISIEGRYPVRGFATFHIDSAQNGTSPYVRGRFKDHQIAPPGSTPGGITSNTVTLAVMMQ